MKKLVGYLIGLAMLFGVFAMIFFAGTMYDNGNKIATEPYFFRTGLTVASEIGVPQKLSEIGERRMRDWLIQKFVTEYFYVVPDVENVERRIRANDYLSVLYHMSNPNVFQKWTKEIVPEIRDMASNGVMRTVTVFDEILPSYDSKYLQVEYELKTWYKPNDMYEVPTITRGKMYIDVEIPEDGIRIKEPIENVQSALEKGICPAVVFTFRVKDIQIEEK